MKKIPLSIEQYSVHVGALHHVCQGYTVINISDKSVLYGLYFMIVTIKLN